MECICVYVATEQALNHIISIVSLWLVKHFIALVAPSFVIINMTEEQTHLIIPVFRWLVGGHSCCEKSRGTA